MAPRAEFAAETVATRLAAFRRNGVEIAFGQSIPTPFYLAGAPAGIRQIAYRQENSGGATADAYARISNKVVVFSPSDRSSRRPGRPSAATR